MKVFSKYFLQQFIAMKASDFQICCNSSRVKPGFNMPTVAAHRNIMPQINMIPHTDKTRWLVIHEGTTKRYLINIKIHI